MLIQQLIYNNELKFNYAVSLFFIEISLVNNKLPFLFSDLFHSKFCR